MTYLTSDVSTDDIDAKQCYAEGAGLNPAYIMGHRTHFLIHLRSKVTLLTCLSTCELCTRACNRV